MKVSTSTVAALFSKMALTGQRIAGRYGFATFSSIFISTLGLDGARVSLCRFSFLALWVVVVDIFQFLVKGPFLQNYQNTIQVLVWGNLVQILASVRL